MVQAEMAGDYGIEGFCYYHYWFGNGRRLLELPFNEVLTSGEPDFPFCLCWANETWKGVWFGASKGKVLIEQTYPGREDYAKHFETLRPAFEDHRYITVDGKPFFQVYIPTALPDIREFTNAFRELAEKAGYKGIFLIGGRVPLEWDPIENGFDAVIGSEFSTMRYYTAKYFENPSLFRSLRTRIEWKLGNKPNHDVETRSKPIVVTYKEAIKYLVTEQVFDFDYFPLVIPNWDNTPRSGNKGLVFKNSTPELWLKHLREGIDKVCHLDPDHRIVMIKSWNEWAEGNYLEPDTVFGRRYLEIVRDAVAN